MADYNTVISMYASYRRAMVNVGWKVKLPANTNPSKTYAYRAINKFIDQVKQWKLDNSMIDMLINEIVQYGKRNGLLSKGTALLNMKSILQICYNLLKGQTDRSELLINEIKKSHEFVCKHANVNKVKIFVTNQHKNGYANITKWFRSGNISLSYISISASCRKALNLLSVEDRYEFPDDCALLRNKIKILHDSNMREKINNIMGTDLLDIGLMESRNEDFKTLH